MIPDNVMKAIKEAKRRGIPLKNRTMLLEALHEIDESARDWAYINRGDVELAALLADGGWLSD